MILETIPALQRLSDEEREVLALELLESISERQGVTEVDPQIVSLLEQRHAEFLEHPGQVRTWSEVKAGLLERYRVRES